MPEIDLTYTLTDSELDAVSGGQMAMATLTISSFFASGPNSAVVNADNVTVQTQVTAGSAPSAQANISGTFTSTSS